MGQGGGGTPGATGGGGPKPDVQSLPGKSGFRPRISAKMQPTDQRSTGAPRTRPHPATRAAVRWSASSRVALRPRAPAPGRRTRFGVVLPREHNLGGAVPPGGDVLGKECVVVRAVRDDAGEPKVADLGTGLRRCDVRGVRGRVSADACERAPPRRRTLRSQLPLSRMLLGLRSRWRTLAEWMYLSPRRIW